MISVDEDFKKSDLKPSSVFQKLSDLKIKPMKVQAYLRNATKIKYEVKTIPNKYTFNTPYFVADPSGKVLVKDVFKLQTMGDLLSALGHKPIEE